MWWPCCGRGCYYHVLPVFGEDLFVAIPFYFRILSFNQAVYHCMICMCLSQPWILSTHGRSQSDTILYSKNISSVGYRLVAYFMTPFGGEIPKIPREYIRYMAMDLLISTNPRYDQFCVPFGSFVHWVSQPPPYKHCKCDVLELITAKMYTPQFFFST